MFIKIDAKRAWYFLLFLAIVGILAGAIFYFYINSSKYRTQYTGLLEKSTRDSSELQVKYNKAQADYENLVKEKESLLIQIKGLLSDRARVKELEALAEQQKLDIEVVTQEREVLSEENLGLKNADKVIKLELEKTKGEKADLAKELEKEKDVSLLRRTENEKAELKKENSTLFSELKLSKAKAHELQTKMSSQSRELEKVKIEAQESKDKLNTLNKDYAELIQKNKGLQRSSSEQPQKFAELARQNKALIKRTANMHYNMGVFYNQQKDYARAAAEFKNAIELNPDDAYAHFNLGYIYAEHLENREKAIEEFRAFVRLADKNDKDVDWAKNYLLTWESWDGKKPME